MHLRSRGHLNEPTILLTARRRHEPLSALDRARAAARVLRVEPRSEALAIVPPVAAAVDELWKVANEGAPPRRARPAVSVAERDHLADADRPRKPGRGERAVARVDGGGEAQAVDVEDCVQSRRVL